MKDRKCLICGCDISHRNIQAKICLSRECLNKHYVTKKICRFCGNTFNAKGRSLDCGRKECVNERMKEYVNERMKLIRKTRYHPVTGEQISPTVASKIKPDSPDSKYAVTYSVASKTVTRGHAGTNLAPNEDAASSDCAWLFKGRTPEKPRPVLDVSKASNKVRNWRQAHKEQFELHKKKNSATI